MKINIEKKVKFGPPVDLLCIPFLYYWSYLTEIFKTICKIEEKKTPFFMKIFPFRA